MGAKVVRWRYPPQAPQLGTGPSLECFMRLGSAAPGALEKDQPVGRCSAPPGHECGRRVGKGPDKVPFDNRVEFTGGNVVGWALDDLDLEALCGYFGPKPLEHLGRQI